MAEYIASLPMYDFDDIKQQTEQLWMLIRQNLPDTLPAPHQLSRPTGKLTEHWKADNLFLSQSCGWPLVTELNKEPLATPVYQLPGCADGFYSSAIIVRSDSYLKTPGQLSNARLVINETNSWSGFHALKQSFKLWGLSSDWLGPVISGSHQQSLLDVCKQRADFAAIDAVSWYYLRQHNTDFNQLAVLTWTHRVPALPLISCLPSESQSAIRRCLLAMKQHQFSAVNQLGITGFKHFTLQQYRQALRYW